MHIEKVQHLKLLLELPGKYLSVYLKSLKIPKG